MTLLTIVQDAAVSLGLNKPSAVIGNTTDYIVELLEKCNNEGKEQARGGKWQELTKEASFNTVSSTESYALSTIASDFLYLLNNTMYDRTNDWKITGVLTPQQWQSAKVDNVASPYSCFRIRGGNILLYPTPTDERTIYFEYVSKNWLTDSTGANYYDSWHADTDVSLIDEHIILLGVIWRWKQSKGLD